MAGKTNSSTNPETGTTERTVRVPAKAKRKHLMWGLRICDGIYRDVLKRPDVDGNESEADAYMRGLASAIRTLNPTDVTP